MAEHRTLVKSVRFSPSEWAAVEGRASEVALPPARYLREAALGKRLAPRANARAVHQLARVGNNLNQLARAANATRRVELSQRLAEVLLELERTLGELSP